MRPYTVSKTTRISLPVMRGCRRLCPIRILGQISGHSGPPEAGSFYRLHYSRLQLFFSSRYNPNHVLHRLLPNSKELTICANVPTTLLYLLTATLLWNRILFIEWFLKTFIDYWFLSTFNVIFTKHFYSETFIVYTISRCRIRSGQLR